MLLTATKISKSHTSKPRWTFNLQVVIHNTGVMMSSERPTDSPSYWNMHGYIGASICVLTLFAQFIMLKYN